MIIRDKGTTVVVVSGHVDTEEMRDPANPLASFLGIALVIAVFVGLIQDLERRQQALWHEQGRSRQSLPTHVVKTATDTDADASTVPQP